MRSARAIERLREQIELPLILAGDFNSSLPGYPGSKNGKSDLKSALDVLTKGKHYRYAPAKPPGAANPTFPSANPTSVIDWILIPPSWSFRSYKVVQGTLSDHRLVIADVNVRGK